MAAYQAHDRVVAADSKPAATLALLQDWWAAWQQAEHDPAQEVIVLAARRAEVDRLNTACQELLAARGRLGPERLQVEDRQLAVGDRVVCGHNAIAELGVANGSRGTITALDPQARTLTLRLDGTDGREVTLPRSYLDGRGRGERNRRVDLAYATTGHRAQGLTRGRALVRLTGTEDVNWLYVQLSRARQDTRLYAVVGPEPQGAGELDLPDREQPDGYLQLAQALSRAGGQTLGHRHPQQPGSPAAVHGRVAGRAGPAPPPARPGPPRPQPGAGPGHRPPPAGRGRPWPPTSSPPAASRAGMLRWLRRGGDQPARMPGGLAVATQQANRAHDRERELRQHQQRRDGWLEANAHLGPAVSAGGADPGLAAARHRPGRRAGPARLCPGGARAGARVDPGPAGLAPGRRRDRAVPAHLPASPIRTGPSAPSRTTQPSGPTGSGPARPSSGSRPSSGPPTAPATRQPTSERTSQPRPRQQRGRPGPERAAG